MVSWVDYRGMQVPDVSTGEAGENLTANFEELANRAAKTNFSATTNPGSGDDVGDGYYPGSLWVNTSAQTIWICIANTSSAAVWQQIGSGVSDGDKGDITVSSSGATWTIDNNVVSDAKLRDSAALSVIGRTSNSTGDPADIAAANDGEVLRRSGTSLGFGTIATAGIADDQVTFAKIQNIASQRLVGRQAASSGDPAEITVAAGSNVSLDWSTANTLTISATGGGGGSGTVTSVGLSLPGIFSVSGSPVTTSGTLTGSLATQSANQVLSGPSSGSPAAPAFRTLVTDDFPNDGVTYAKLQNVSATDKILGRSTAGAGDVEEIACTPAARSILDDTTTGAMLATLLRPRDNVLINGNMDIAQRGTSVSATSGSRTYLIDRWYVNPSGAAVTYSQDTSNLPDARSKAALRLDGANSVTSVLIGQRISSHNTQTRLKGTVTFSAVIGNNSGSSFTPSLLLGTPTGVDGFGTVNNRLTQSLQSCPNSAWTRVTYSVDISGYTDVNNGLQVEIQIPSGSLTSGKQVWVAQAKLEFGDGFSGFYPRSIDEELRSCLAYCWVLNRSSAAGIPIGNGQAYANNAARIMLPLPVPMRVAPGSVAVSNASHFSVGNATLSVTVLNSLTMQDSSPYVAWLNAGVSSTPYTAGQVAYLTTNTTSGTLTIEVEL